jgi:hypothetical protein
MRIDPIPRNAAKAVLLLRPLYQYCLRNLHRYGPLAENDLARTGVPTTLAVSVCEALKVRGLTNVSDHRWSITHLGEELLEELYSLHAEMLARTDVSRLYRKSVECGAREFARPKRIRIRMDPVSPHVHELSRFGPILQDIRSMVRESQSQASAVNALDSLSNRMGKSKSSFLFVKRRRVFGQSAMNSIQRPRAAEACFKFDTDLERDWEALSKLIPSFQTGLNR